MVMVTFANAMNAVQQISPIFPSCRACLDSFELKPLELCGPQMLTDSKHQLPLWI